MINWSEQFKVRVKESDLSQAKHLIVKSLIVLILKTKYKNKIKVETEKFIGKGIICDVYQEFPKEEKVICYEIQKENTKKWEKNTIEKYSRFKEVDLVIIPLKRISNDINKLVKEIEKIVV